MDFGGTQLHKPVTYHPAVSVTSSCYNVTTDGGFVTTDGGLNEKLFSLTALEAGSPRSGCWQGQGLVSAHFQVHRQLSFRCPHTVGAGRELSFIGVLIPFVKAPPLLRASSLPPDTLTFGVRFHI